MAKGRGPERCALALVSYEGLRKLAPGLLSCREPPSTFGAKLLHGPRLALGHILRCECLRLGSLCPDFSGHLAKHPFLRLILQ
jgi:hypothetical protein